MTVVKRADLKKPTRPAETIEIVGLHGGDEVSEVIILGLDGGQRLDMRLDDTLTQGKFAIRLLSLCVVDADRCPVFTEDEWRAWTAGHSDEQFLQIVNRAMSLSGFIEPAKKT